jgi:hypothetical protein
MSRIASGCSICIPLAFFGHRIVRHNPSADMRSIWRHREALVQMASVHIQHMQKALDQTQDIAKRSARKRYGLRSPACGFSPSKTLKQ